jgi:hypothetical protein
VDQLEQLESAVSKNCSIEAEVQKLENAKQLQCVDLMSTMSDVMKVNWGKDQGKVQDLVTELKMQSGCGC